MLNLFIGCAKTGDGLELGFGDGDKEGAFLGLSNAKSKLKTDEWRRSDLGLDSVDSKTKGGGRSLI